MTRAARDLREALDKLRSAGELIEVDEVVSVKYDVAAITARVEERFAVLFNRLEDFEGWRIASGLYTSEERVARLLGISVRELRRRYERAVESPQGTVEVSTSSAYEVVVRDVDLSMIPMPVLYERMPPYLTASIVVAHDPETGVRNLSYHRMTPIDRDKLVVRVVKRDLWTYMMKALEQGRERLEAVVVIGVDPATALAAATSVPIDVDELEVASALAGEPIEECRAKTVSVRIPARVEVVLEGEFLLDERADEGPFVDITGTLDEARAQPVFKVKLIAMRRSPILHVILPAGAEHRFLMGYPAEVMVRKYVSRVTRLRDVHLSRAGCGWLEAILAIEKRHPDEPINAGLAAIAAHPSLKRVIVVDSDIDVRNRDEVEWAVLTRAHPVRDYIVIPRARGSSLDKTGEPRAKVIIDATIKGPRERFTRARVPLTPRAVRVLRRLEERSDAEVIVRGKTSVIEGEVIKVEELSFLGDVSGDGRLPDGRTLRGKILCMRSHRGSTVGALVLYRLAQAGAAPTAILVVNLDTVLVSGAALAGVTLVRIADDLYERLRDGQRVTIEIRGRTAMIRCR